MAERCRWMARWLADDPWATLARAMDVRQALIDAGDHLDDATWRAVLALGSAAVPELIGVLQDEALLAADGPGEGFAPVHAVRLLGELADPRAVEPLLALILEGEWDDRAVDAACVALPRHGRAALEPLLAAHDAEDDPFERALFGCQLADLGVEDERIYERLVAHLGHHPEVGGGSLARYGDARALPFLCEALDACDSEGPDDFARPVIELSYAIETLGGELTQEQEARRAAARRELQIDATLRSRAGSFLVSPGMLRVLSATLEDSRGRPLWWVRGYLAALASQPSLATPSRWLGKVLPASGTEPETIDAIFQLYNATLDAVAEDPDLVCPMVSDVEATTAFCKGYVDAATSDPEWVPARRAVDALGLIMMLAGEVDLGATASPDELGSLQETTREKLPELLLHIHEALAPVRLELARRGTPRPKPRVGRNEPCPCGSGKKYKRCCGN
jgi:uncharacterized protein YecA (UPF0149 family)